MASTDVVRTRIDGNVKEEASNFLGRIGLLVADVIRMLPARFASYKALPLDVNDVTNAERKKS